jgi:hypothetical protein
MNPATIVTVAESRGTQKIPVAGTEIRTMSTSDDTTLTKSAIQRDDTTTAAKRRMWTSSDGR